MMPAWKLKGIIVLFLGCISLFCANFVQAQDYDEDIFADDLVLTAEQISDPLEPINRAFFVFNDKLYFWVLKPVSQTYGKVLPEDVRMCIGNAFRNITAPIRIINNLLQGKVADSGTETARFLINTIAGAGGLGDPASDSFRLYPKNEDLGQTLGKWGVGEGVYICWPILGPSNVRDTIGYIGDAFLNPLTYVAMSNEKTGLAAQAGGKVNSTSLTIGDYESFKEASFDPYTAMRDFYYQSRQSKILDKVSLGDGVSEYKAGHGANRSSNVQYSLKNISPRNLPVSSGVITDESLADLNNIEKMFGDNTHQGYVGKVNGGSQRGAESAIFGVQASRVDLFAGLSVKNDRERM